VAVFHRSPPVGHVQPTDHTDSSNYPQQAIEGVDRLVLFWLSFGTPTGVDKSVATPPIIRDNRTETAVNTAAPQPANPRPHHTTPAQATPAKQFHQPFEPDEFFGHQRTSRTKLANPRPLIENLTRCVVEILAGARDLEQIARWVSDDVYRHLLKRVVLSTRARQVKGVVASRPAFSVGSVTLCEPTDGIVEAVVVVHGRARTRAVAIRLEGLDNRWRATAINVL